MKKGFTLIELLAVIVILAIVAAISTPIVLNITDNVKDNSLKISLKNVEKAANLYYHKETLKENKTFECNNNKCEDGLGNKLNIKGRVPSSGSINISKSGHITFNSIILDGYLCDKYSGEFTCNKTDKNIVNIKEESLIIKGADKLSNYKIYGNSIQEGIPSVNLPVEIVNVGDKTKNLINWDLLLESTDPVVTKVENGYYVEKYASSFSGILIEQLKSVLKPNVTYTLSRVYSGTVDASNGMIVIRNASSSLVTVPYGIGTKSVTFTLTQEEIDSITGIYMYFHTSGATISDLQLEESDVATDYETYGYKIPLKVSGKNLVDEQTFVENGFTLQSDGSYYVKTSKTPYQKKLYENDQSIAGSMTISFYIKFVLYNNLNGCFPSIYYTDGTRYSMGNLFLISNNPTEYARIEYITPDDKTVDYIIWTYSTGAAETYIKEFQLEYANDPTEYEPYQELITNIYLDEPLRKIGNYVDYIDYRNKLLVRNVGVLKLTGKENWQVNNDYFSLPLDNYAKLDKEISISNYLEYEKNFWYENDKLNIKIDEISDIEVFKEWLKNNHVEIHYPLDKSVITKMEFPQIKLLDNYSNINFGTLIKPSNLLFEY